MEANGEAKMADDKDVHETQLQVRFSTKLEDEKFHVVNTPFAVPSSLNRYGLSEIINALLGLSDKPIPFDFLLDGELLRTSLETYLLAKNLSAETILEIEYMPAVLPPSPKEAHLHDDWVSAVDGSLDRFIFTGSYDNLARVWSSEGVCVRVLKGHTDAITSLSLISSSGSSEEDLGLVTTSKDRTVRLWQKVLPDSASTKVKSVQPTKCFNGHTSSVQTVASSPSGSQIASGAWDSSIKLWNVLDEAEIDEEAAKKRKLNGKGVESNNGEAQVTAQRTLEGHTQCVSQVAYAEEDYLYSVSWDHSVRSWNLETGDNTSTLNCSKALLCLSIGGEGSALIATGGADRVLRIWDPRMVGVAVPVLQLTSHQGWITSCRWHRRSTYHILSSSHDGTVKLWDVRAKVPLHTADAHTDKVFCADWWKDDCIVSGGADSKLNILHGVKLSGSV
ncbi:unnamed protein product [Calypogeia fissa]